LGLFSFVINGLMILLASYLVSGFHVSGILWAMLFGVALSLANTFLGGYSFTK
jgi:putative membrane protein